MEEVDKQVQECAKNEGESQILLYKRFIDDILLLWKGSEEKFLEFMDKINSLHPTIKFT